MRLDNSNSAEIIKKLEDIILLLSTEEFNESMAFAMKDIANIMEDSKLIEHITEYDSKIVLDKINTINRLIEDNKKMIIESIQNKEKELSILDDASKNLKELF